MRARQRTAWSITLSSGVQSFEPFDSYEGVRRQYAILDLGMFGAMDRMGSVLGSLGS